MTTFDGLRDKRVLVTAAGGGIGRVIARAFLDQGARVHVCDIDEAALAGFASEAPGLGRTVADVSDAAQVDRLFEDAAATLGGLDVLVNNAGIAGPTGPIRTVAPEDWRRTLAVNLDSHYLCARRAVPLLETAGGGAIVALASTAGLFGYPLRSAYAASKWAVIGLVKSLAIELGPSQIRVNAVCPGSVEGPRMARVIAAEAASRGVAPAAVRTAYERTVSLHTFVTAEDIAATVLFLCSDAGARISGQALAVDGDTHTLAG